MKVYRSILRNAAAAVAAVMGLASCDSLIYDTGQDKCDVSLRFRYDYNMKYADAFANEVNSVSLYAFDPSTGKLAGKASDSGKHIGEGYYMTFTSLPKGTYDLVAWCGLDGSGFTVEDPLTKEDLICCLDTKTKAGQYIDTDPGSVYYGYVESVSLDVLPPGSVNTVVIPLIKNTNNIRVMLQALNSSSQLEPDEYEFIITDDNAVLNWKDELPSPAYEVEYRPWDTRRGTVDYNGTGGTLTACVAEFTVNRLFAGDAGKTRLNVVDKTTGTKVIDIPLVDYFLMVKGNYNKNMTDQEYLDRQDDYQITFFLDNTRGWNLAAGIYINSWHVVLLDSDL